MNQNQRTNQTPPLKNKTKTEDSRIRVGAGRRDTPLLKGNKTEDSRIGISGRDTPPSKVNKKENLGQEIAS
jgi:hypothetical protein